MPLPRRSVLLIAMFALGCVICGCATNTAIAAGSSSTTRCTTTRTTTCIVASEGNKTVQVKKGGLLIFQLHATGRRFNELAQVGTMFKKISSATFETTGEQARYQAVKAGTAKFRAVETAVCPVGTACPQFALLWQVSVKVTG